MYTSWPLSCSHDIISPNYLNRLWSGKVTWYTINGLDDQSTTKNTSLANSNYNVLFKEFKCPIILQSLSHILHMHALVMQLRLTFGRVITFITKNQKYSAILKYLTIVLLCNQACKNQQHWSWYNRIYLQHRYVITCWHLHLKYTSWNKTLCCWTNRQLHISYQSSYTLQNTTSTQQLLF